MSLFLPVVEMGVSIHRTLCWMCETVWLSLIFLFNSQSFALHRCNFVAWVKEGFSGSCQLSLISFSFYISSNISVTLRNLIIFFTSQRFPSYVIMLPWILYFFLLSLHCRQCFIKKYDYDLLAFFFIEKHDKYSLP